MSTDPAQATTSPPTIHEAERASGGGGAILYGPEIELDAAVARRQAGEDVVVRGDDVKANRRLAGAIESAVGPCFRSDPHRQAGPLALPHFQQDQAPPGGHTFYETDKRKARKKR
jgi:hypothetical protein